MLLAFGFNNFFSFKEGANISFQLDAKCPETISAGKSFSNVLCVKGANASGKTNLIRSLSFLAEFCTKSFSHDPDSPILVESFYKSKDPTGFYVEFSIGGLEYRYELETTEHAVVRESIFRTKSKRTKIVERVGSEIVFVSKEFAHLKTIKLRRNASLIASARQYELGGLEPMFNFFSSIVTNVSYGGLRDGWVSSHTASDLLSGDADLLSFVQNFIRECDVGIEEIQIHETANVEGRKEKFPVYFHKIGDALNPVLDAWESSGTRTLFRFLGIYKVILNLGGVLALDEFDINLHPHILPKLIDLFLNPEKNPKNAQLFFTTHDGQILNLLGRYRTCLVNKVENESFVYRLDEIPGDVLRNDRPILPVYNDGKIGGVPRI